MFELFLQLFILVDHFLDAVLPQLEVPEQLKLLGVHSLLEGIYFFDKLALLLEHGGELLLDIPFESKLLFELALELVILQFYEFLFLEDKHIPTIGRADLPQSSSFGYFVLPHGLLLEQLLLELVAGLLYLLGTLAVMVFGAGSVLQLQQNDVVVLLLLLEELLERVSLDLDSREVYAEVLQFPVCCWGT